MFGYYKNHYWLMRTMNSKCNGNDKYNSECSMVMVNVHVIVIVMVIHVVMVMIMVMG